jgi:polyisoprenoid-binding protein YceI
MKHLKLILPLLLILMITNVSMAQVSYHAENLHLVVSGTSSMHDWDMKSSKGTCNATFTFNTAGGLTGLSALSFSTPAESLKSDRSAMDKNAYKALKTKENTTISYMLTSAIMEADNSITCKGKLSIAGVTQHADLVAVVKVNADKSLSVKGTKKVSMKNFNMSPPTFMMGAVKTGNDVTLTFDITFNK